MVTSIWLTILTLGFAYFYECDCESTEVVQTEGQKHPPNIKFDSLYTAKEMKLYKLNVGDAFTKDSLFYFIHDTDTHVMWIDTKSQIKKDALYEVKGGISGEKIGYIGIQWRFYIRTSNNIITSIIKN